MTKKLAVITTITAALSLVATLSLATGFCTVNTETFAIKHIQGVILIDKAMENYGPPGAILALALLKKKNLATLLQKGDRVQRVGVFNQNLSIVVLSNGSTCFIATPTLNCPNVIPGK